MWQELSEMPSFTWIEILLFQVPYKWVVTQELHVGLPTWTNLSLLDAIIPCNKLLSDQSAREITMVRPGLIHLVYTLGTLSSPGTCSPSRYSERQRNSNSSSWTPWRMLSVRRTRVSFACETWLKHSDKSLYTATSLAQLFLVKTPIDEWKPRSATD